MDLTRYWYDLDGRSKHNRQDSVDKDRCNDYIDRVMEHGSGTRIATISASSIFGTC